MDITEFIAKSAPKQVVGVSEDDGSSEFVRGLRGGANSFMSGINNAMGGVAQPMGYEGFAQGRFKAGKEYEEIAQKEGPSVASLRDIHGIGDAAKFMMGGLGQTAIPAAIGVGAGLLTKSPGKGLAAATAAMTPETFGHAVGEYRHTNKDAALDPNTALRLGGTAVASSAIQNIVPVGVGSMLRGSGAAANAARGFMPTMGRAVATDIGGNAVAGGVADVVTQAGVNPGRSLDMGRSIEAAATGGVMGVPFVGAHAVGYAVHSAPRAGLDGITEGAKSIKNRLKERAGALLGAEPVAEKAKPVNHVDALNEISSRVEDPMVETLAAGGRPDPTLEATAEGQAKNDQTASEWAKTKGEELMKSTGLTKANYDSIAQAMQDPSNPTAQKAIALVAQGVEKAKDFGNSVVSLAKGFDKYMVEKAGETKKSEDYSGTRAAISEHVMPWLEANKPEVLGDPVMRGAVADGVRRFMEFATKNRDSPIPAEISSAMNRLFNGDVGLLSKLHEAVVGDADTVKSTNYVKTVKELARDQAKSKTFEEFVGHSMTDGAFSARRVPLVADRLITWANEKHPAGKSDNEKAALSAQAELKNLEMEQYMRSKFGDKADAVEQALKAHVTKRRDEYAQQLSKGAPLEAETATTHEPGHVDADGEWQGPPQEEALDRIVHKKDARSKAPDAVMNPALFDPAIHKDTQNYGKQQLEDAKAKYGPDYNVRWISGDDLTKETGQTHAGGKDHGHIVAERAADPERITPNELSRMALKAKTNSKSPARIEVLTERGDKLILDAVKITQVMKGKTPRNEGETAAEHEKRAFLSGAAELMREHGKFKIDPETVISYSSGEATKFGTINKLRERSTTDTARDAKTTELNALRQEYAQATWSDERLKAAGLPRRVLTEKQIRDLAWEAKKLTERDGDKKAMELLSEGGDGAAVAAIKAVKEDMAQLLKNGYEETSKTYLAAKKKLERLESAERASFFEAVEGKFSSGKDSNVSIQMAREGSYADHEPLGAGDSDFSMRGSPNVAVRSNMDGSPRYTSATKTNIKPMLAVVAEWADVKNPAAAKIAARADTLLQNVGKMASADRIDLLALGDKSVGEAAPTINRLARKYADVIVAPGEKAEPITPAKGEIKENPVRFNADGTKKIAAEAIKTPASAKEGTPDPKLVAAKKAALIEEAASGDKSLLNELSTSTDAKGLQRAAEALVGAMSPHGPLREMREVPEKFRDQARAYLDKVLGGNAVDLVFDTIGLGKHGVDALHGFREHAGKDVIVGHEASVSLRVDRSLIYHESMHALFARLLNDERFTTSLEPMLRTALSSHVQKQLDAIYKSNPEIQAYYKASPEESLAYAYQHWAEGRLTITDKPTINLFGRIKEFLNNLMHVMSDDARTEAMFSYFKSGELGKELRPLTSADFAKVIKARAEADFLQPAYAKALTAANERLATLVQDPDTAYGMMTPKYSLVGTRVHEELGREGFAATHDSPIRHEGKFDWRAHIGKGEGNASFGAGTYLSTAEGVHKSYKNAFTAVGSADPRIGDMPFLASLPVNMREQGRQLIDTIFASGVKDPKDFRDGIVTSAAHLREYANSPWPEPAERAELAIGLKQAEAFAALAKKAGDDAFSYEVGGDKSPTYETSVNIKPEQLLDWDAPLFKQDKSIREALVDAAYDEQIDLSTPAPRGRSDYSKGSASVTLGDIFAAVMEGTNTGKFPSATGSDLYNGLALAFKSQAKVSDYLQSLGILGHKYAADGGKNGDHPNYVIYDDSKISTNYVHFDKTSAGAGPKRPTDFQAAKDYLTTATPWVKIMLANISHAGEFTHSIVGDVIRLSTHALNPLSTAHHESLHAFFQKLSEAGATDVMDILNKAAQSPHVMKQLREFLKNEPAALKQLSNPEERAAYMYQLHAAGELKLNPAATTIFGKIKDMVMQALGMWTNDARALHIMDYFQSGEYAKNMGNPSAVHRAMMDQGRNKAVERLTEMAKPLSDLGMAVVGIGSQRLRDTGIPALREVADMVKATGREKHNDKGYLPTARDERAVRMNDISSKLEGYTPEDMGDALGAMQRGVEARTAKGIEVQKLVQAALADTLKYMQKSGVDIEHIGAKDGVPYFPRVWDTDYISKNKADFMNMLSKYERRGELDSAQKLMDSMIARDGAEFGVESREPGMQFKKQRTLAFISHADAAVFMSKDLHQTLNSYVTQATRRAEWSRRFADDGSTLDGMLVKAKEQGATNEQLAMTEQYLKGVDGTLGDTIDPGLRRLMGNVIVYQNIRLLPLAIFSSVVDPVGLMVNGASAKEAWSTFKRGIREIPLGFKDQSKQAKDYWTEMTETLGVIDNATLHQSIGALYNQGMVGGTAQKINDTFFKLNLMEQYNRSMRIGATEAATRFIARHAIAGESRHSERWLAELGLKASDVKMYEGALALTEAHGLTAAEATKMRSAVNQWVDGAILRPDAADKPIWMNDPRYMLISHLKQFVYSFHQTILKKVAHEAGHGNYAPVMAMASYVPIMIAADMMKGMIQGGGSQPDFKDGWGIGDYIWSGLQRAGLFGVGQFGIDVATDVQRGGLGIGALAGPTLGQMGDVLELMGGHKQFGPVALHAMPANALYSGIVKNGSQPDPMMAD